MKIAINNNYGGFELSKESVEFLKGKGINDENELYGLTYGEFERNDPLLIETIEKVELVKNPNSSIEIVEIPDEATDWTINEYDGLETVIYVLNGKIKYAF